MTSPKDDSHLVYDAATNVWQATTEKVLPDGVDDMDLLTWDAATQSWVTSADELGDETNVTFSPDSDGGTFVYDENSNTFDVRKLGVDDLAEVGNLAPNDGDVLQYDAALGKWVMDLIPAGGASSLDTLTDTDVHPHEGDSLTFDADNQKWVASHMPLKFDIPIWVEAADATASGTAHAEGLDKVSLNVLDKLGHDHPDLIAQGTGFLRYQKVSDAGAFTVYEVQQVPTRTGDVLLFENLNALDQGGHIRTGDPVFIEFTPDRTHASRDAAVGLITSPYQLDLSGNVIHNVGNPRAATDAMNKATFDAAVQTLVSGISHGLAVKGVAKTPPAGVADGSLYIVDPNPTGAFSGHANAVATFSGGTWTFKAAANGNAHLDESTGKTLGWSSATSSWVTLGLSPAPDLTPYALLAGAAFTGAVSVPEPKLAADAATKKYVDDHAGGGGGTTAGVAMLAGATFTGQAGGLAPTAPDSFTTKKYVDDNAGYLVLAKKVATNTGGDSVQVSVPLGTSTNGGKTPNSIRITGWVGAGIDLGLSLDGGNFVAGGDLLEGSLTTHAGTAPTTTWVNLPMSQVSVFVSTDRTTARSFAIDLMRLPDGQHGRWSGVITIDCPVFSFTGQITISDSAWRKITVGDSKQAHLGAGSLLAVAGF